MEGYVFIEGGICRDTISNCSDHLNECHTHWGKMHNIGKNCKHSCGFCDSGIGMNYSCYIIYLFAIKYVVLNEFQCFFVFKQGESKS